MHSSLRYGAAFGLAGMLAGCAVGPDFEPPAAPSTAAYTGKEEAKPAPAAAQQIRLGEKAKADWWTLFRSEKLDRLVDEAVANNGTLAAADATLGAAQEEVAAASGAFFPHLSASAGISRQRVNLATFGFHLPPPVFNLYSIGPSVSYSVDVFGGTRRQVESLAATAEAEGHRLSAAYLTLTGNVATQSIAIASLRAQLQAIEDIIANDEKNLGLVRTAEAGGLVSNLDVLSAESQLAADRTQLPPIQQTLSVARHALSVLVSKAPADWSPPEFDLADFTLPQQLPVSLPSDLVHARPDILVAEAELHAASAKVGVATARAYPNVTLTASVAQAAVDPGHLFKGMYNGWSFGGGILAPIFEGGTIEAERQASIQAFNAAAASYKQTVVQAFAQVADVLQALDHDRQELDEQAKALDYAKSSLDLARLSYSAGQVGILQVLDSERQYGQARLGYVRVQGRLFADTVQLFVATGSGWTGKGESGT
jgi:NodT family efflux transporter outer membrane factor (OMF) lipoprotein